jgi:dipeptidyl aminopeptidase/acylaminoacyl peptidase
MTRIPLADLFGDPAMAMPRLSPDGRTCAYLSTAGGVLNVWIEATDGSRRQLTHDDRQGIRAFEWTGDSQGIIYQVDNDGDENFVLFVADLHGAGPRSLTPVGCAAELVAIEPAHPATLLVAINDQVEARHDLYSVDLSTGTRTLLAVNPGYVQWLVDTHLRPRGGVQPTEDGGWAFVIDDEVRLVTPSEDAATTMPVGFTAAGDELVLLTSTNAETSGVCLLNCSTGHLRRVAGDDEYDVEDVLLDPRTRRPLMALINGDRPSPMVVESNASTNELSSLLPDAEGPVWPVHADADGEHFVLREFRDNGPSSYFVFDTSSHSVRSIGDDRPWLCHYILRPMEPFSFRARDGLLVRGYLTRPQEPRQHRLPAVLIVHGGPWDRISWGFDAEAQWVADLGYLCIQVNFRGSTGYGKQFVNAGDREWGARMHSDLIDAIDRLAETDIVDPDRVAILGASYGGYAALVGAAFTPERFTCAVDAFGPSNLISLLHSLPAYWAPTTRFWHQRVGDPDVDQQFLEQRSPLFHADKIGIPLFVAQGLNDARVRAHESEQIVAAVQSAGLPVEYQPFANEGHGFNRPENRLDFYSAVERFLLLHLPKDPPAPAGAATGHRPHPLTRIHAQPLPEGARS